MGTRFRRIDEPGTIIQLIRWRNTADGWQAHYAKGRVNAHAIDGWMLDINGQTQHFRYDDWAIYSN